MASRVAPLIALASLLCACAASQGFTSLFPTGGERLAHALARAKAVAPVAQRAVIVGVTREPDGVFAYDLGAQRLLFRVAAEVVGLPSVAGELVVVPERSRIAIRRLQDGSLVHELPARGMHLIGADGDGTVSAIALSSGGDLNVRSRLVLLEGETISADLSFARVLGGPAVLGGLAFVPHQRVHLSVVEPRGQELARVRVADDVASQAFRHEGDIYFGQRGVYRLDEATERGIAKGAHYLSFDLKGKLPADPPLLPDNSVPPPAVESALYRVCLSFLPNRGGPTGDALALQGESLYLAFYRQLYALTPDVKRARWVYETQSDVVGVRAIPDGLIAVESRGAVLVLDSAGRVRFRGELGVSPIAARIRAEHFAEGEPEADAEPLPRRLERAARNADTRLVPSRAFAAHLLGPIEDDQAARALIALCADEALPVRVRTSACETLARRDQVSDAVIAALAQHANYLEQKRPPPVGPLALAALRARDRRALPELLSHLQDPATPADALAPIVRALARLGDAATAPPLAAFLNLYHADVEEPELEEGLLLAIAALAKLDPARARATLDGIANDAFTRTSLREAAQRALAQGAEGREPRQGEAAPEAGGAEAGNRRTPAEPAAHAEAKDAEAKDEGPPAQLTSQHVDETLSPVRAELARCVREAAGRPASARLILVINGEGGLLDLNALPTSVQACAAPVVRGIKFPATKYGKRAVMTYTVER